MEIAIIQCLGIWECTCKHYTACAMATLIARLRLTYTSTLFTAVDLDVVMAT